MKENEAKALFMAQYLGQRIISHDFYIQNENFELNGLTITDINIAEDKFITIPKFSLIITGDFSEGTAGFNQTGTCSINQATLLLHSIDQLTDEEIKTLCQLYSKSYGNNDIIIDAEMDNETGTLTFWYHEADKRQCSYVEFEYLNKPCTDYLKSIGICLDFTYLSDNQTPITLSVDDLVAKGWVKLI